MHLLKKNQEKINIPVLNDNTGIFIYDYDNMKRPFTDELISVIYHPSNIERLLSVKL